MAGETDGRHDFDFLFGRWRVHNERLIERLVGCQEWEHFEGAQECRPILGGLGNIDEQVTAWNGGFIGVSLRVFDLAARRWSIHWVADRTGVLEPPVHGSFAGGVGTFFGRDEHRGTQVLVRYLWSEITPESALWQQAFSTDEGGTWETNWRMRLSRRGAT